MTSILRNKYFFLPFNAICVVGPVSQYELAMGPRVGRTKPTAMRNLAVLFFIISLFSSDGDGTPDHEQVSSYSHVLCIISRCIAGQLQ